MKDKFRLGIVGHGFVGSAVDYAFTHPMVETKIADPKYGTTVDDLLDYDADCVFVCAPTPMGSNHVVDASIVEDVVTKLIHSTDALVVVKSTVTPDVLDRLIDGMTEEAQERFVYNPEFLTEKSAQEQFVDAKFHVFGGTEEATEELAQIYEEFSSCTTREFYKMSAQEASFVKYGINTYLATKVTFFNELYDLVNANNCNFNKITRAMGADSRVGISHTRVPGYDGKRGFGGACFPKDIAAFMKFSETHVYDMGLIRETIKVNNSYRKDYEKCDREKVNNITFGDDE